MTATAPGHAPARTPTPRESLRRARPWIALAGVVVAVGVVGVLLAGGAGAGRPLGPQNPAPAGAKAVVEVLRQQGIDVRVTTSLGATTSAADDDPAATTVVVDDADGFLGSGQWAEIGDASARTLLLAPDDVALGVLAPGVSLVASVAEGTAAPGCALPALDDVDRVDVGGLAYAVDEDAVEADDVTTCLRDDASGGHGLVEVVDDGHVVTVLGATTALTNGAVAEHDDAAAALRLLGATDHVVWYLPGVDDVDEDGGTLATLTPDWVTPVLVLLALTAVAAGVWRGRRLGPLVVERLPVVVSASETTEGRARLYERSGQRRHALDQLRIGALGRLRRRAGLPGQASVDDVVERLALLLPADRRALRHVLVDADPADDAEMIRLSDSLLDLERAVSEAVAPR